MFDRTSLLGSYSSCGHLLLCHHIWPQWIYVIEVIVQSMSDKWNLPLSWTEFPCTQLSSLPCYLYPSIQHLKNFKKGSKNHILNHDDLNSWTKKSITGLHTWCSKTPFYCKFWGRLKQICMFRSDQITYFHCSMNLQTQWCPVIGVLSSIKVTKLLYENMVTWFNEQCGAWAYVLLL